MIQYNEYTSYFKHLAQTHKSILHSDKDPHFFRSTLEEALSAMSNRKIKYPAVMLLPLRIRFHGHADNRNEKLYGGFLILDTQRTQNDFARVEEILVNTRNIAEDFMLKIIHDIDYCPNSLAYNTFMEFNPDEMEKKEWGPVWDNAYGWSYEFPLFAHYNRDYNPEVWL